MSVDEGFEPEVVVVKDGERRKVVIAEYIAIRKLQIVHAAAQRDFAGEECRRGLSPITMLVLAPNDPAAPGAGSARLAAIRLASAIVPPFSVRAAVEA